jgi:membrane protease YdiL (CAAX protease family)
MFNVSSKTIAAPPHSSGQHANVAWGPVAAIIMTIVSFLAAQFAISFLLVAILSAMGWDSQRASTWLDSITGRFTFIIATETATILLLYWFIRRRKGSFRSLGFWRRPNATDVGSGVIGFVVYFVLLIAASALAAQLLNINLDQRQELGFDSVIGSGQLVMAFMSLVLLPPLVEETIFRGFLYTGLRKKLSFLWTTAIVSGAFGALHLFSSSEGLLWIAGIDTLILSVILCYLREKTGNLWAGILVHAIKNGIAFFFLYIFVAS